MEGRMITIERMAKISTLYQFPAQPSMQETRHEITTRLNAIARRWRNAPHMTRANCLAPEGQ